MLKSVTLFDPRTESTYVIQVSEEVLGKICDDVRSDPIAMDALRIGNENNQKAIRRGDISSPKARPEYRVLYEIMNKYDARFAGVMGSRIINYTMDKLIE